MAADSLDQIPFENLSAKPDEEWIPEVKQEIHGLREGVDAYYEDAPYWWERRQESEPRSEDDAAVTQIEDACHNLTLLGVDLPIAGEELIGGETTRVEEDVYALARWVYDLYDDQFPWCMDA